jgi:Fe-S cluster biogenesis protein NfuA
MCQIADICGGNKPSTDVDHDIPAEEYVAQHGGDARYFFDDKNLQGACHACHSAKTARGR